ncbi:hypothetical protein L3049_10625 [Labilibaculum sp. DW002]|uniref:Uncharacterized protein n=1 Tax=Paralabilibaculum antarcticum TaxID=2912572 RepID=A0ABT5VST2_9BACT|nr:hypothetical protein [Labilibaculum sp. DW002]MDE5418463.1 hypothetical protein [Labilibaculum sp. DW002]
MRILRIILLLIVWIIFPPIYIYLIAKNNKIQRKLKIVAYCSLILSPFTLCFVAAIVLSAILYQPGSFSVNKIEDAIGIDLPLFYETNQNNINYNGSDYNAKVILVFSETGTKDIVDQIKASNHFNLQHKFHGSNEMEWLKSDTIFYYQIINDLQESNITGYWIKTDSVTYKFYEPDLSDIPNSSILFHEGYNVSASFLIKDRKLEFNYYKY